MQRVFTFIEYRVVLFFLFGYLCINLTCSSKVKETETGDRYLRTFLEIEDIRNNYPVDFISIKELYSDNLAIFIQSKDLESHIRIQEAIREGIKKNKPHIQSQIVNKTIQKVFFNSLTGVLSNATQFTKANEYKSAIASIEESYKILSPTVLRGSEWIGRGSELDDICLKQIKIIKKEKNGTTKDFISAKKTLFKNLTYAYVLSIFYEFDGIEENINKNHRICEEKAVNARFFFETIKDYAKSITLKGLSEAALSLKYSDMDIENMRRLISETFLMKPPDIQ